MICYQVNLQRGWGGGEVYTTFFSRALAELGIRSVLLVHPSAAYWKDRLPAGCQIVAIDDVARIAERLPPGKRCWLLFHTPAGQAQVAQLRAAGHLVSCIAHMPLYGRNPDSLRPYELIVPVSRHVLDSLTAAGISQGYAEPLYGVADLSGRHVDASRLPCRSSPYDWDRRKVRDRLLGLVYPIYDRLMSHAPFERRPGITLGIVSRLTPIKQFPLLFRHLSPVLARHPQVNVEIFGSGGYASVRDLRRSLAPIRDRVRYWGHQTDVAGVYRQLDYLLTGLPEKEALGLNVIEAQACGIPVLAVNAPPFTETVADGISGLFYRDPREDSGAGFDSLLSRLEANPFTPDTDALSAHLARFSEDAFVARVARLVAEIDTRLAAPGSKAA